MNGRLGHTGKRQRRRLNNMEAVLEWEKCLLYRGYVTYMSAHLLYEYIHMQRVKEAKLIPRPGFPATLFNRRDEGDLSEALQQRDQHTHRNDCKLYLNA